MADRADTWFGMRLTREEKRSIKRLAERDGVTAKEALLRLVRRELEGAPRHRGTFLDGIEHLVGSTTGPIDLSSNSDFLDGLGANR